MGTESVREVIPTVVEPGAPVGLLPPPMAAPRLSPRKRSFCSAFQATFNLKKAIAAAGITALPGCRSHDPIQLGQHLLREKGVQAYMEWIASNRSPDYRPPVARIRDELMAIAGNDASDLMEFSPPDVDGFRALKRLRFDRIDGRAISAVKVTELETGQHRIEVKFHPKVEALKVLAEEAGMLGDNNAEARPVYIQINVGG